MKQAPCYKTIQNTMNYLQSMILAEINQQFLPGHTQLGGVDSSGMKTHRKGAWLQVRFHQYEQKKDFKKIHIFVDLLSKKIIYCLVTKGNASDHKQLKKILKECDWVHVDIILGDKGYDTPENVLTRSPVTAPSRESKCARTRHVKHAAARADVEQ